MVACVFLGFIDALSQLSQILVVIFGVVGRLGRPPKGDIQGLRRCSGEQELVWTETGGATDGSAKGE